MLGKSLEWLLSASSADKWVLGKIKVFREQIHKCQNFKVFKRHCSATSSSSQRNCIGSCKFFDKRLNNTLPSRYSPLFPISAISPKISISKTTSLDVSTVSIHFTQTLTNSQELMQEHWDNSLLPSYTKMRAKARAKLCCPNPILIIVKHPRHRQAELCRRNDGLRSAWKLISVSLGKVSVQQR